MRYDNLAGGGFDRYDGGETLVHEVGHWLGLEHTFSDYDEQEDGRLTQSLRDAICSDYERGDRVYDTPAMLLYSGRRSCLDQYYGYAPIPNSCPDGIDDSPHDVDGPDPIFNHMNYVDDDECFQLAGFFSCGQIERMYLHWVLFRDHVTSCAQGEMEIEIVMDFDDRYSEDQFFEFYSQDENGDSDILYLDSRRDIDIDLFSLFGDRTMLVDLCVPSNLNYTFYTTDERGDGLRSGYFAIFKDGDLMETIEGNFGDSMELEITSEGVREISGSSANTNGGIKNPFDGIGGGADDSSDQVPAEGPGSRAPRKRITRLSMVLSATVCMMLMWYIV